MTSFAQSAAPQSAFREVMGLNFQFAYRAIQDLLARQNNKNTEQFRNRLRQV
jgi:hypothetical protein